MNLAREWTAFSGALFALMGTSLAAAARKNAGDALSWERQWRRAVGADEPADGDADKLGRLVLAYRFGGLFFAGVGLGLLWCAARGASFAARGGPDARLGGLFFTACGLALAFNAWSRRGRRAPRFLEGVLLDEDAPPAPGERVAAFCSRAMIVLMLAFGVRLLAYS
jgi:hypothetical protein